MEIKNNFIEVLDNLEKLDAKHGEIDNFINKKMNFTDFKSYLFSDTPQEYVSMLVKTLSLSLFFVEAEKVLEDIECYYYEGCNAVIVEGKDGEKII